MHRPFRIIIVGGGIGGLSAAIALRHADRDIVILEQSTLNKEIGATISLQPNASKIVEQQWALEKLLKERGSMVDHAFVVYAADGTQQMHIPLATLEKYGAERMMYHRMDLHEVLKLRATGKRFEGHPAVMRKSARVAACDCDTGIVTLESGERLSADLIIGADGIKSVVRRAVLEKDVSATRTGYSAYRFMIPTERLEKEKAFTSVIDPKEPRTTMVVGHDRRLIMGPARDASIFGVVALVPDEGMREPSNDSSWVARGSRDKMLEAFEIFPEWAKQLLYLAEDTGLWQLRDLDPLPTWHRGRAVIIGDAAHAMLPTQGQGASQAVEDAEALGAFYEDIESTSRSIEEVLKRNQMIFECRFERASTVQAYSRQTAKPATNGVTSTIKMNPAEFMDYNCSYNGALDWIKNMNH